MNDNVTYHREKWVGGSDLPNILGFNTKKYGTTPYSFALEKLNIIPKKFTMNEYTKYGQYMEPIVRDYINSIYNVKYLEDTKQIEERGLRGNVDGIDINAEYPILEVKTFGSSGLDVKYYEPQVQFYLNVYDQPRALLVGYQRPKEFYSGLDINMENDKMYFNLDFDESRIETHVIERDDKYWSQIQERIIAFQNACAKLKENPEMSEEEFNNIFYGTSLTTKANQLLVLENQLAEYKKLEKQYDELKTELYNTFEDLNLLSFEDDNIRITKVSPTSYTTETVDTEALKEKEPTIYEQYKKEKITNKKGYIKITLKEEK